LTKKYLIQQSAFVLRHKYFPNCFGYLRNVWLKFLGMKIGTQTNIPKLRLSWPHKVSLGKYCVLEPGISFKFDGPWAPGISINIGDNVFIGAGCEFNISESIVIGHNSLIAAGCRFIDHDHGIEIGALMRKQSGPKIKIVIGMDVWLGCNVVVLKGVTIGDGAIVAAGAIVTKSILPNEIWAGVPAKKIGTRR
jgi:acetyltransferase-like isoleucine patch superfamily enzyme